MGGARGRKDGRDGVCLNSLPPKVRTALEVFDVDNDAFLTESELAEVQNLLYSARNQAGALRVDMFPTKLRKTLAALDNEGDGVLEMEEVTEMVELYVAMKESQKEGTISISSLPKELRAPLNAFDVDGDGTVAPLELARGAELYQKSKKKAKRLTQAVIGLTVVLAVLLAAFAGITFVVIELSKDTTVENDGTTLTKTGEGVMKVGKAAFEGGMSSLLPDAAFEKLTSFKVTSDSGAYISMNVNGYVRLGDDARGDVILMTHFGLITVSGSVMTFEDVLGDVFSRAGFNVASSGGARRRLTGFYEMQAMFNDVTSWESADGTGTALGDDFVAPRFPENYEVDVSVLYRCDTTFKIPGRIAAGIGNVGETTIRRDYIMYDGRRCHYPGTRHNTVTVGGQGQEFQKIIVGDGLALDRVTR